MQKFSKIGTAGAFASALSGSANLGCETASLPMEVNMIMGGYTVDCDTINQFSAKSPLNPDYCNSQITAELPPSVFKDQASTMKNALACAFNGLINFNHDPEKSGEMPEAGTLFLGGQGRFRDENGEEILTVGGNVRLSTGYSSSLVMDTHPDGTSLSPCTFFSIAMHETGHALIHVAQTQSGLDFSDWGLDANGHDLGGNFLMDEMQDPICEDLATLNFSNDSARVVAENAELSATGLTIEQVVKNLTSIDSRCREQIQEILNLQ